MADVSELRIELIFPRSTLAKLTPRGVVGAGVALADVGVPGFAVGAAEAVVFDVFVGVHGSLFSVSDFGVLETAVDDLSLSSATYRKQNTKLIQLHKR